MLSMLKALWRAWKAVAHKIGNFQARALLTLFYLVIALPFALIARLSSDPLALRRKQPSWVERTRCSLSLDEARRQF